MVKEVTTRGRLQGGIDVVLTFLYIIGGCSGIMYASVLKDLSMWFFFAAGVLLLFSALERLDRLRNPAAHYETKTI